MESKIQYGKESKLEIYFCKSHFRLTFERIIHLTAKAKKFSILFTLSFVFPPMNRQIGYSQQFSGQSEKIRKFLLKRKSCLKTFS